MNLRKLLLNLTVLGVSAIVGLLLCELGARLILHPADYLSVEMVPHPALGAVPSPNTSAGGLDSWGFRNRSVPDKADIVAIGDSHTYGNTATMNDSWPYALGRLMSRNVYNMGLGGYGPNQYFELLKSKALALKPRIIVCGLYMGDDFENAFLMTYGLDHWAFLRELPAEKVNFDIWEEPPAVSRQKKVRMWLSQHSVVYQVVVHGPLLGRLLGEAKIKNARGSDSATSLTIPERHISEAFLPKAILLRLDQNNPSIREGMRITFKLFEEMNAISRKSGAQFVVVVIPTKEMVFSEYFDQDSAVPLRDVVQQLLASERLARERTFKFFNDSGIPYVDTLPALKQSREHELYARTASDMHPGENGYRVIADAVFAALKQDQGTN